MATGELIDFVEILWRKCESKSIAMLGHIIILKMSFLLLGLYSPIIGKKNGNSYNYNHM